ncbi:unnamed protein product [Schistocephalus solidus]|uniref:WD_REPEATS_REGION domain-containing protein n=1 Tax=Schistocephalus solidus TaxID=70667 RepID=A0A183SJ22_SCHSO|nr:unnamed protein product [Schistocephalus solidus]
MGSVATNARIMRDCDPVVRLEGHHEEVNCIAVSTERSLLASGSEDCSVRIWDFSDCTRYECIRKLVGHTEYVVCLAFVGNSILSGSGDMTIRKWNILTGACDLIINKHDGPVTQIVATPFLIFSTSSNSVIHAWSFDSGRLVRDFVGHTGMVYGLHLTGADAEDDPQQGQLPSKSVVDENETKNTPARAPITGAIKRRMRLISYSDDCTAKFWAVTKGNCLQTFCGHCGPITCVAVDTNAHCLYTGSIDGTVGQWLLETGQLIHWFKGHTGPIISLTVRGDYLYTASSDETARAWVTDLAQSVQIYKGHQHTVFQIELKDEMRMLTSTIIKNLLVVASQAGCLYGWNLYEDVGT